MSRNEGFGLTPLEAIASGTAGGGGKRCLTYAEMIVADETGAVVPAGDGDALTAAIRRYLADPALSEVHGRQGLSHVRRHFPLSREARSVETVYGQVWETARS